MTTKDNRSTKHSLIHVEPFEKDHLSIADFFTTKFDYVVVSDMYRAHKKTLAVYDLLRQIMADKNRQIVTPIITLSPDPSVSASTIAGGCEKFMYSEQNPKTNATMFKTDLKVIYIDPSPDLSTRKYENYDDFRSAVLSDVLGINEESYSLHRVDLPPENVTLLGIDDRNLADDQDGVCRKYNIDMFTQKQMRRKGLAKFMKRIVDKHRHEDVHIVIDLSVVQQKYAPSVIRDNNDPKSGFDFDELKLIVNMLKQLERINGVDITGYNFGPKDDKEKHHTSNLLTVKVIEMIVGSLIELKQKSINIFNEDSKFLIWRKVEDMDDIGWYILRGLSLQDRETFISAIGENNIVTVPIAENDQIIKSDDDDDDAETNELKDDDDEETDTYYDALVTVTTLREQQEKSYYVAESLYDCCLYPGEKLSMMFELLNTPAVQIAQAKEYAEGGDSVKEALIKLTILDDTLDGDGTEDSIKDREQMDMNNVQVSD